MRHLLLFAIGCLFARSVQAQFRQQSLVSTTLPPVRRIENGVTVLRHDTHAFERAPQLALVGAPITVVNGADGDATFDLTGVGNVALLSDGRLMTIADIGSRLLVFGPDGRGQRMIGRQGQGPGEFMGVNNVFAGRGDTLLLLDDVNERINWVLPDGRVVRMRPRGDERHSSGEQIIGRFPSGALAVFSSGTIAQNLPSGVSRSTASVFTLSPDGHASLVAKVPDLEMVNIETRYRGRKESMLMPPRLGLHALAAMLDTFIVVSAANAYELDVVDQHARLVSRIVVDNPRRVVNKSMRDADLSWQLKRLHGPGEGGMIDPKESERLVRTSPFVDSLPSIARMFVAPDSTLWVLDGHARSENSWAATAFRSDGAIVGRLVAAGSGRPVAFGNDRVVIKSEDADGVVSLTVRRIAVTPRSKR